MVSPWKGLSLTLYLTWTNKSVSALLAQEIEGVEQLVYYLSGSLQGPNWTIRWSSFIAWTSSLPHRNSAITTLIEVGDQVEPFKVPSMEADFVRGSCSMVALADWVRHNGHQPQRNSELSLTRFASSAPYWRAWAIACRFTLRRDQHGRSQWMTPWFWWLRHSSRRGSISCITRSRRHYYFLIF